MTADQRHVLLLAGTAEARALARQIADRFPKVRLTASFAGAVTDLPVLKVPTRVGGFGGIDGLIRYLDVERVSMIVDATHPFAAQMSRNAQAAANAMNVPLIRLERPAWQLRGGDRVTEAAAVSDAVRLIPQGARAFLAVGRKEIERFYARSDIFALVRMIEPPERALPEGWTLVLGRPPQDVAQEVDLLKHHRISQVVAKNSGGTRSFAKIEAANRLGLHLIMIARPQLPPAQIAPSVSDMLVELSKSLDTRPDQRL